MPDNVDQQARIQGENILHAVSYVKRKKGTNGVNKIASEVDFDLEKIFPEGWYPFEWYLQLLEHVDKMFGYSDYSVSSRIGFDRARTISFLKHYKENPDPISAFETVAKLWSRFNGFGRVEVQVTGDCGADIYLRDYESHPLYCQRMEGFLAGILIAVCRVKEGKVEKTECVSMGKDCCKFKAAW